METNERKELYKRTSRNRLTGEITTFRLLAGPGFRWYQGDRAKEIQEKDRIIYIELSKDGLAVEWPYSVIDQEKLWELVFDVWVLPQKRVSYANRFRKLIDAKLVQAKLEGFSDVYSNSPRRSVPFE